MNCWRLFIAGVFAGCVLLLLLGGGYHLAGTPGFCGSCHSMERVHQTWQDSTPPA